MIKECKLRTYDTYRTVKQLDYKVICQCEHFFYYYLDRHRDAPNMSLSSPTVLTRHSNWPHMDGII